MQNHDFYLALAYGAGALLLAIELFMLARRCRYARKLRQDEQA
jgi:heme exporter protein CcmD